MFFLPFLPCVSRRVSGRSAVTAPLTQGRETIILKFCLKPFFVMSRTVILEPLLFSFTESAANGVTPSAVPQRTPWDALRHALVFAAGGRSVKSVLETLRKDAFVIGSQSFVPVSPRTLSLLAHYDQRSVTDEAVVLERTNAHDRYDMSCTVAYAREDLSVLALTMTFRFEYRYDENVFLDCCEIVVGQWKPLRRFVPGAAYAQTRSELEEMVRENRPYVISWLREGGYDVRRYVTAPYLETLDKAGYAFASSLLFAYVSPSDTECVNRLVRAGTRPKTIFKTDRCVYETLRDETSLQRWDAFRRMVKSGRLTRDSLAMCYDAGYGDRELREIGTILGAKHEGRNIFTWTSLMNYLRRLDMYEALEGRFAIQMLGDYLLTCRRLGIAPRVDGDSLRREHDVAARLLRNRRNEEAARRIAERSRRVDEMIAAGDSRLARLEYHESLYFIRPVRDYDDLIDEAKQQHNCVAAYADAIANGTSIILVMRYTETPDRSLVTIELSPDLRTVRQKSLAYNRQIRNRSQSEFIERWLRQLSRPSELAA